MTQKEKEKKQNSNSKKVKILLHFCNLADTHLALTKDCTLTLPEENDVLAELNSVLKMPADSIYQLPVVLYYKTDSDSPDIVNRTFRGTEFIGYSIIEVD